MARRVGCTGAAAFSAAPAGAWAAALVGAEPRQKLTIAAAIGIGYIGGHYLDHRFGTDPWIGYIGLLAGIGAAVKALGTQFLTIRVDLTD